VLRFLEGEPLLYNGWVWIVKGVEHPDGYVVAYPRYCMECIPSRRLYAGEGLRRIRLFWWDCIGLRVPVIPCRHVYPVHVRLEGVAGEFIGLLSDLAGIDRSDIVLTGSLLIGGRLPASDVDIVVYGWRNCDRVYRVLGYLRESGVTAPLGLHGLLVEYRKHRDLLFRDYMLLRGDSVLQGIYLGKYRYTVRLVPYDKGFFGCRDPVVWSSMARHRVLIVKAISPYTTPAVYEVRVLDQGYSGSCTMLSYRIRYTELREGMVLDGLFRIERRRSKKLYLIPDHGSQRIYYLNTPDLFSPTTH